MAARFVLTIAILQLVIVSCCAVNGIIWRKQKQEFVQLFSIPQFAALHEENLAKRRAEERLDMKNEVVKAVFYEDKNMVMFYDNDTKVRGICGELWHLLADYLNFTFIPIKTHNQGFGQRMNNGSYDGLVGMLAQDEAQVIMRSRFSKNSMDLSDCTVALWKTSFHIYVHPKWMFDNKWVLTLFSPITWYFIVFLFIILSCVGYFLQKIPAKSKRKKKDCINFSLEDHFFYFFAMMCAQGYIPDAYQNKFKILFLSKSLFAWLILLTCSANLIYRMTNRETTLPFKDLETLFDNTKYVLLVYRGSSFFDDLYNNKGEREYDNNTAGNNLLRRVRVTDTPEEMHIRICDNMEKYAMIDLTDRFMILNRRGCLLKPIGNYNESWATFSLKKNFRYKKTIDSALIKFYEVGLLDVLKDRWLDISPKYNQQTNFIMIDLRQVFLIFLILCFGILISLAILILENINYYYYDTEYVLSRRKR